MKVIIIGAGTGKRIGEFAKKIPKSLLKINGKTILERQISLFKKNNLNQYFEKIFTINELGIELENNNFSNRIIIKTSLLRLIIKNYSCLTGITLTDYSAFGFKIRCRQYPIVRRKDCIAFDFENRQSV